MGMKIKYIQNGDKIGWIEDVFKPITIIPWT